MKLTYWTASRLHDSQAYAIRTKTKREAVAEKARMPEEYGPVNKVTFEYADAFDLLVSATGECGAYWEPVAYSSESLDPPRPPQEPMPNTNVSMKEV